jgi:hypothetical protein
MAVSDLIPTYKLLNHWQRLMGENIWRYNGVQGTGVARNYPATSYLQPARDEVALALNNAVSKIVDELEYYPRPVWITDEVIPLRWSNPYQLQTLQTRYKHLIEFGSRGTTLIAAGQAVVYSDSDSDTVNDTATITVAAGALTDTTEIQIFFRTADGAPASADELWEIEPTTVTLTGGNFVITAHRALFVMPSTIWAVPYTFDVGNLDTEHYADIANVADFVTSVDVYRVYNDTTNAVQLVSDDLLFNCDCSSVTTTYSAAGSRITDKRLGVFEVRATSCGCSRPYEAVKVNYRAGLALVRNAIDPTLAEAIIRYANTHFGQQPCAMFTRTEEKWTYDRDPEDRNLLTPEIIHNPFGIQRGAIFAWRTINNPRFRMGMGSKLTSNTRI